MAVQRPDAQRGPFPVQHGQRGELTANPSRHFQTDHQHHQGGAGRDRNHSDRRHLRRRNPIPQLHVHQELGQQRRLDDELLGNRDVRRRWADLGGLPRNHPHTPGGGNENFQQGAFVRPGDGYLYSFGTPPGRGGSAYVARVPQGVVPDLTRYEYWNSDRNAWVPNNPSAATPVIPGPLGEMSAQYNTYLKRYLVLYCNGANDVVARTAPAPQGPWGPEQPLVSSFSIPGGIYAPFLHPWSTGKDLYFNLSLWSAYNVMLMHAVLP